MRLMNGMPRDPLNLARGRGDANIGDRRYAGSVRWLRPP
jgi:hypothetical protein